MRGCSTSWNWPRSWWTPTTPRWKSACGKRSTRRPASVALWIIAQPRTGAPASKQHSMPFPTSSRGRAPMSRSGWLSTPSTGSGRPLSRSTIPTAISVRCSDKRAISILPPQRRRGRSPSHSHGPSSNARWKTISERLGMHSLSTPTYSASRALPSIGVLLKPHGRRYRQVRAASAPPMTDPSRSIG